MSDKLNQETERVLEIGGTKVTHTDFYRELVVSAKALIDPKVQKSLMNGKILVAGAGSVGNPVAMLLVRSGAENVIVADPGDIEISNLPRQHYTVKQIGRNKADATVRNMLEINPFAHETIQSVPEGITLPNVRECVKNADIVIDGVEIRELDVIYELHRCAAEMRKPVLVGYDLAGTAMIAVYRYDLKEMEPLKGELNREKIEEFQGVQDAYEEGHISEAMFLDYIYDAFTGPINPLDVPVEQLEEILNRNPEDSRTYQLGTTSTVLSGLSVEAIRRILAGEEIKDTIIVDIPSEVRRSSSNPNVLKRIPLLLRVLMVIKKRREHVNRMLNEIVIEEENKG